MRDDDAILLSIVVPTFNRAALLRETIDSALAQTVKCEVVVVDHGSTDATPAVAASYGNKISYVRRDTDDGPCIAWLDGVLRANGRLIHINYDDDWIAPTFADKTIAAFADDIGVVFTNAAIVDGARHTLLFQPPAFGHGRHPRRATHPLPARRTAHHQPGLRDVPPTRCARSPDDQPPSIARMRIAARGRTCRCS